MMYRYVFRIGVQKSITKYMYLIQLFILVLQVDLSLNPQWKSSTVLRQ